MLGIGSPRAGNHLKDGDKMSYMTEQVLADVEETIIRMASKSPASTMLDVGCWDGRATKRYAVASGAERVLGLEIFPQQIKEAEARGVQVHRLDLEDGKIPIDDESIDLVVCNQVFEHLKGIFDLASEIHRILRPGGHFIFSVPNVASLHNRLLLLFGAQPTSIRLVGPHVRAFSYRHTRHFLENNDLFAVVRARGCGFYPFPIVLGRHIGRVWIGASHTFVLQLRKSDVVAANWSQVVNEAGFQTVF